MIWKSVVVLVIAILLLRITGRKTIAQMTASQILIICSYGTLIAEPLIGKSMIKGIWVMLIFSLTLLLLEHLQLKSQVVGKIITGSPEIVINNGKINIHVLKKMRITVEQLEERLRNKGISYIKDVKSATIESNGELGYELTEEAQPLTVGEFKKIMKECFNKEVVVQQPEETNSESAQSIFENISKKP